MRIYHFVFSVLLSTSLFGQIGPDGTGTVNGWHIDTGIYDVYYVGPGADLSRLQLYGESIESTADLSGADLSNADLSNASLSETIFYGADLRGAVLFGTISDARLEDANLSSVNFENTDLHFLVPRSDYNAVLAERDARPTQAAYDTVVAERDARPTQNAYDALVAENSEKYNLKEIADLRTGSKMIEIVNGQATLSMDVESSDELGSWTVEGNLSTVIPIQDGVDKKFFRFKMDNSDSSDKDINFTIGDTEYNEAAIIEALAEQYGVPTTWITITATGG